MCLGQAEVGRKRSGNSASNIDISIECDSLMCKGSVKSDLTSQNIGTTKVRAKITE